MGRLNVGGIQLLKAFLACHDHVQSLATIQKDGATEVHESFSPPFGHLHESFLDSSVVGHGNDFLR